MLGVITGIVLTFAFAFYVDLSNNSGIIGLELFEEPGDYMEYSQLEVFQVVSDGCALAHADDSFGSIVFILPKENQQFYDKEKIIQNPQLFRNIYENKVKGKQIHIVIHQPKIL